MPETTARRNSQHLPSPSSCLLLHWQPWSSSRLYHGHSALQCYFGRRLHLTFVSITCFTLSLDRLCLLRATSSLARVSPFLPPSGSGPRTKLQYFFTRGYSASVFHIIARGYSVSVFHFTRGYSTFVFRFFRVATLPARLLLPRTWILCLRLPFLRLCHPPLHFK